MRETQKHYLVFHFLITKFDDKRWVENFHMTKATLFHIVANLKPIIGKQDTNYRKIIPIEICVCCAMYKLAQGANFLVSIELFAMGKSIVSLIFHEFVYAINQVYSGLMKWLEGPTMTLVMEFF